MLEQIAWIIWRVFLAGLLITWLIELIIIYRWYRDRDRHTDASKIAQDERKPEGNINTHPPNGSDTEQNTGDYGGDNE